MPEKPRPVLLPDQIFFQQNIRIFHAVCHWRSFTAAAQKLNLTQSAVSQGIANLERQIGATLFLRATRPLTLTAEAQLLRDLVTQLMGGAAGALDRIRSMNFIPSTVRVGVVESVGRATAPHFIKSFLKEGRHVELTTGPTQFLYAELLEDRVDLIVAGDAHSEDSSLRKTFLYSEPAVVMLPKSLAKMHDRWTWKDLQLCGLPLVRYSKSTDSGKEGEAILKQAQLSLPALYSVDDNQTIFSLVASGLGWCLTYPLTALLAAAYLPEIELIPAPPPASDRKLFIVSKRQAIPELLDARMLKFTADALQTSSDRIYPLMPWTRGHLLISSTAE